MEIERKFLVKMDGDSFCARKAIAIDQAYFTRENGFSFRLRRKELLELEGEPAHGIPQITMTAKMLSTVVSDSSVYVLSRLEAEGIVSNGLQVWEEWLPRAYSVLHKIRFYAGSWEIDSFHSYLREYLERCALRDIAPIQSEFMQLSESEIFLAEIELQGADERLPMVPRGIKIITEVTGKEEFTNEYIAKGTMGADIYG